MAKPLLDLIPKTSRSALSFVRQGVSKELSIKRIGDAIRKGGIPISNANLGSLVRAERAVKAYLPNLSHLGRNSFPNPARLPEALTRLKSRYVVELEITSTLLSTGARKKISASISSSKLLSPAMIEQGVRNIMQGTDARYGFEMESFRVTGYMKASAEMGFGF